MEKTDSKTAQNFEQNVNRPVHYASGKVECIDAIESATQNLSGLEAVCTANVIKYVWRWKAKNGLEDLHKARWYLDKLIATATQGSALPVEPSGIREEVTGSLNKTAVSAHKAAPSFDARGPRSNKAEVFEEMVKREIEMAKSGLLPSNSELFEAMENLEMAKRGHRPTTVRTPDYMAIVRLLANDPEMSVTDRVNARLSLLTATPTTAAYQNLVNRETRRLLDALKNVDKTPKQA